MDSHVVGLLGRGIGQSRSPGIHEREARAHGLPLAYRLIDFTRIGKADDQLADVIGFLRATGFSGANVTFPFKQAVLPLCDVLSAEASALGAVNTLVFDGDAIRGENTDWIGFAQLVQREFGSIEGAAIAQVGAGGAGSATAFALASLGAAQVNLYDPDAAKAHDLAERLSRHARCRFVVAESAEEAIAAADGVVNATPVGMASVPGMPFAPAAMTSGQWLADIIYFPLETELMAHARRNGQKVANGVTMVVGQAAEAFRLITGIAPDLERMHRALLAEIAAGQTGEAAQ